MAKKYNFRPDKPRGNLLSHLTLTKKQQLSVLKWGLYALLLIVVSVVQDVLLSQVRIFGVTTELVPCVIFLISIWEGGEAGSIFSLAGSLFYLFSGTAPGSYAMAAITFLSVGACLFRQAFLRENFFSAAVCTALAMAIYEVLIFAFGLFFGLTLFPRFWGFLLTAALSLLIVPILYPVVKAINAIGDHTWKK